MGTAVLRCEKATKKFYYKDISQIFETISAFKACLAILRDDTFF
jgi:hypothetical protein